MTVEVVVEDLNSDGRGRGQAGRKTALISQAYPGDRVVMRVDRSTRGTLQGRVQAQKEVGPHHVSHPCAHAFQCTGCPLLSYDPQPEADFKRARVVDAISTTYPDASARVETTVVPTTPFGYRHLAKQVAALRRRQVVLGSYVHGTHEVVSNRGCPVLVPALAQLMDTVTDRFNEADLALHRPERDRLGVRYVVARQSRATGEQLVTVVTSTRGTEAEQRFCEALVEAEGSVVGAHLLLNADPGNVLLAGRLMPVAGRPAITDRLLGVDHVLGPLSFFQINPAAAEVMFTLALEAAGGGRRCIEGYAGVGAMTFALAKQFEQVVAIENHPEAVAALRSHARGRDGAVEVRSEKVESCLGAILSGAAADLVVLDPPRRGLGAAVTQALVESDVPRVILLSCQPDALRRDLPSLGSGGFVLEKAWPIDQFPRTAHVEALLVLRRE